MISRCARPELRKHELAASVAVAVHLIIPRGQPFATLCCLERQCQEPSRQAGTFTATPGGPAACVSRGVLEPDEAVTSLPASWIHVSVLAPAWPHPADMSARCGRCIPLTLKAATCIVGGPESPKTPWLGKVARRGALTRGLPGGVLRSGRDDVATVVPHSPGVLCGTLHGTAVFPGLCSCISGGNV